ncbi:VanZ family protein [Halalkalibacter alkalisediminis]|uniref:VanZ family protein n=1 Tax=Halalkalibacter alkalisediminis TaxID=935616 RepID=A0ABV6NP71_9BACI|nr:VanZ family protein [Halalkalibacter alkalisediminis]
MYLINVASIGIVIIVLYFIIDLLKKRKKNMVRRLIVLSFLVYAINVMQQITGGIHIPPLAENYWSWDSNIQLIPFYFVGDLINHYNNSGYNWFFWNAVKLSFYNALLLLPLGVYLSIFKVHNIKKAVTIIFSVSFGIETLQIILGYLGFTYPRSFNVDDLILNTLGGFLGYLVFEQLKKLYSSIYYKKQKVNA